MLSLTKNIKLQVFQYNLLKSRNEQQTVVLNLNLQYPHYSGTMGNMLGASGNNNYSYLGSNQDYLNTSDDVCRTS